MSLKTAQKMVEEFHNKFNLTNNMGPGKTMQVASGPLRSKLMVEELKETMEGIDTKDLVEVADGLADLIYVALGTAVAFGIDLDPVFKLVHESNMKKVGGKMREDGKILKPAGWQEPDIAGELTRQVEEKAAACLPKELFCDDLRTPNQILSSPPEHFRDILPGESWDEYVVYLSNRNPNKGCSQAKPDMVNSPKHYIGTKGLEVIEILEQFELTKNHYVASAVAYLLRAARKGEYIQDLKKARFYIDREIKNAEETKTGT